ncbi:MAG: glutamate decarboxylase, partial [Alphaproteobacteria bacterium]
LAREIGAMGPFEIIHDGSDIPVLSWRVKDGNTINGHSLFDLSERMRNRGWQVPSYTLPRALQETAVQRIVVRHGFSRDLARALLVDLRECVELFEKYERHPSMGEEKKQGFTHL